MASQLKDLDRKYSDRSSDPGVRPIGTDRTFAECVVLDADSFDPDRVFHEDIVDDSVLPSLSLAVDGLTDTSRFTAADLELPISQAANEPADTRIPDAPLDPEHLEVYGWESSFWGKLLSYLRF